MIRFDALLKTERPAARRVVCWFCGVLLTAAAAPSTTAQTASTPFQVRLDRVERQLAIIKMEMIRVNQSAAGKATPKSATVSPPAQLSATHPETSPVGPDGDLTEIAALMKKLETADGSSAARERGEKTLSGSDDGLRSDEMQLRLADRFMQERLFGLAEKTLKDLAVQARQEQAAAESWFRLEKLYYRRGDEQQTLGAFFKIPENIRAAYRQEAIYMAGNSYLHLKDYKKAIELFGKIEKGSEYYPFALHSSGIAYLKFGNAVDAAETQFKKVVALNPGRDAVLRELVGKSHVTLGFLLIDQKRYEEAVPFLEAVPPDSLYWTDARLGIGRAYIGMEKCVAAVVVLKDVIRQAPIHPYAFEARLHVGNCYSKMSAYRRAVDSYQNALQTYSARKEELKQLIQRIQTADTDSWFSESGTDRAGKAFLPVSLQKDLELEQDFPALVEDYQDWKRLDAAIARRDRSIKADGIEPHGLVAAAEWEQLKGRARDVRLDLEVLIQAAATQQLTDKIGLMDDLILRANIGIAKNTILMQDYGTRPSP